jgi:hypothetical protein
MSAILPRSKVTRQAQITAKRSVAKKFAFDIQKPGGAGTAINSYAGSKLVGPKLEMVRAAWLPQHSGVLRRSCWLSRVDRFQCSEIDGRLQGCFGSG